MSSFIFSVKSFLINLIIPLLPSLVLLKVFDTRLLPNALHDLEIVRKKITAKIKEDKLFCRGVTAPVTDELRVVALIGLPQVGKTTVAETIISKTGFFHLNSNEIRAWLIDAGRDYSHMDAILLACLQDLLTGEGVSVVIDSDCASPAKRAFIEAILMRAFAELHYVAVVSAFDIWKSRLSELGYYIHRMYADGVKRGLAGQGVLSGNVPVELVRECVISERRRQEPLHNRALGVMDKKGILTAILENNGSELSLRAKADKVADLVVL